MIDRDNVTFSGMSMADLASEKDRFSQLYRDTGVVYLPRLLADDPDFRAYVADLARLTNRLGEEAGISFQDQPRLEARLTLLANANRKSVGSIYDVGTRPAKLISAVKVKYHAAFLAFIDACFGPDALVATPTLSDTLHVFPPGAENYKYNLPIHQDFPYLIQSPQQITIWISLSELAVGSGGITVWLGSHTLGIAKHRKNAHGHYEAVLDPEELAGFPSLTVEAGFGDVLLVDSLCLHRSEPNRTTDQTRITQLFRYSNLNHPEAIRHRWISTDYSNVGEVFPRLYPDRFAAE